MTIDEAIKHAKEKAEQKYNEGMLCHANPDDGLLDKCIKCAKEHEQLAEWLEELKERRQTNFDYVSLMDKRYYEGYNKAIDDFIDALEYDFGTDDEVVIGMYDLREVAKQLREGDR